MATRQRTNDPGVAARAALSAPRGRELPASFYDRPTEIVAAELLGAELESETQDGVVSGRIVETEAYLGSHDPACHAVVGRTKRTWHLHGPAGIAYIYLIYGLHWCFNAVTGPEGTGSAVLVRALEPLRGVPLMRERRSVRGARSDRELANGPGKLCEALGIDGRMDGVPLRRSSLRIRSGPLAQPGEILVSPRIGISQAADWPLRYFLRDSPFVSRAPRHFPQHSHPRES